MDLAEALLEVGTGRAEASFALFAQTLDPQWIDAALQATGAASVRRRKLPAEYVVWLVICRRTPKIAEFWTGQG